LNESPRLASGRMDELRLNPAYYGPEHLALREALRRFVA
jgi:hypothetical protein